MQSPLLDLTDTVDHNGRDHGWCVWDVVCENTLRKTKNKDSIWVKQPELWLNFSRSTCTCRVKILLHTSPILTGVPPRLGMHGRGQRSRHSGCETTLQSLHFSEILPNLILFPQGTQDSGLMTYKDIPQETVKLSTIYICAAKEAETLCLMACINRDTNEQTTLSIWMPTFFFEAQGWVIYFPKGRKRNWDYCWGGHQ